MILLLALLIAAPSSAVAQTQGLTPAPLCKVASDNQISWFPYGVPIRWHEYNDMPAGTFGCFGLNHDYRPGSETQRVDIDFDLLGTRDFAQKLIVKISNPESTWFDASRRVIPLLNGLFRAATGFDFPGNVKACVETRCSGDVSTALGALTLQYTEGRSGFEYILTFNFVAPPPAPPKPPAPRPLSENVKSCLNGGRTPAETIGNCTGALVEVLMDGPNERLPPIYTIRARARIQLNEYEGARSDLTEALKYSPNDVAILHLRGAMHLELTDYSSALSDFNAALRGAPRDPELFLYRGEAQRLLRHFTPALDDYSRAIALQADQPWAYHGRGLVYSQRREYDASVREFSEALQLRPRNSQLLAARGVTYLLMDRNSTALDDVTAALAGNPKNAVALFARGVLGMRAGDFAAGEADIAAATKINPGIAAEMNDRGVSVPSRPAAPPPPSSGNLVAALFARAENGVLPGDVVHLFGLTTTPTSIPAKLVVVDNDPVFNVFGKSLTPGTDDVIFVRVTPAAANFYLTDASLKLRAAAADTGGGLRLILNEQAAAGYADVLKFWRAR
jgi:tetratricopeptide (TPR) repeat protein